MFPKLKKLQKLPAAKAEKIGSDKNRSGSLQHTFCSTANICDRTPQTWKLKFIKLLPNARFYPIVYYLPATFHFLPL